MCLAERVSVIGGVILNNNYILYIEFKNVYKYRIKQWKTKSGFGVRNRENHHLLCSML